MASIDEPARDDEASDDALTFEDAMERLEAIIDRVESGEAGLEQAIRECERGAGLIARCRKVLLASEKKIAELDLEALAGSVGVNGEASDAEADDALNDADADPGRGSGSGSGSESESESGGGAMF